MNMIAHSEKIANGLHTALSNDLGVAAIFGSPPRLYDAVPEDPAYPYLSYGEMRSSAIGGDDSPVYSHLATLHIWSRYQGRAEIIACLAALTAALESDVHINDVHLVSSNILYADHFRAPDGRTLHGVIRLNLTTEPET